MNGSGTCEQDLKLTSATSIVNGTIAHGNFALMHVILYLSTYHDIPRQAIPYTMWCPPGHIIYHAMAARPYHTSCHAHQSISYIMPCIARPCNIPCYASPDHTLYHIMPARPYYIPCHAHQAIPYTMTYPPGYIIYYYQAIPYTMPCPPGHTFSHAMPARPSHIPCHASPGHNIY